MSHFSVVGIEPGSSDEYLTKATAWRACVAAGVNLPDALVDYFGGSEPVLQEGSEVEIPYTETEGGLDIERSAVPDNVKTIRVTYTT